MNSWTANLFENTAKEDTGQPDFRGKIVLDRTPFDAAAWLNRTLKDNSPYVGMSLSVQGDRNAQKFKFSLWQKKNRAAAADPHLRGDATIGKTAFKFSAWLEHDAKTGKHRLRLEAAEASDAITEAAAESRKKIQGFMLEVMGEAAPTPASAAKQAASSPLAREPEAQLLDPDLETQPDDIPF